MNAQQFTQQLGIDPNQAGLDRIALQLTQSGELPDASQQLAQARALEAKIESAFAIAVPDLSAQILAGHRAEAPRMNRRGWLSMAAGVTAVALTGGGFWLNARENQAFARACANHLSHEPFALARQQAIPETLSARVFAHFGFQLASPLDIQYAQPCFVNEQSALHLVLQRRHGPVTALLFAQPQRSRVRDARVAEALVRVRDIAGGTLVLLAETTQDFDQVEASFLQSLRRLNT
jgi:hypothetical protein